MHEVTPAKTRQAVAAAVIGNVLEWYDFAVYAFVAIHISRKFFPAGDEVSALLATFLAYGLGFLARPAGDGASRSCWVGSSVRSACTCGALSTRRRPISA
jgi:hypothetical protein